MGFGGLFCFVIVDFAGRYCDGFVVCGCAWILLLCVRSGLCVKVVWLLVILVLFLVRCCYALCSALFWFVGSFVTLVEVL